MKLFVARAETNNFNVETACFSSYHAGHLKVEKILLRTVDGFYPSLVLLKTNMNTHQVFQFDRDHRVQFMGCFNYKTDFHGVYKIVNPDIYFEPLQSMFCVNVITHPELIFQEIIIVFSL